MTVNQDGASRYSPPPPYERPSSSSSESDGHVKYIPLSEKTTIELTMLEHQDPNNPFAFTTQQLNDMLERRNMDFVHQLGGIESFARGLHSSTAHGICDTSDPLPVITLHNLTAAATTTPSSFNNNASRKLPSAREQRNAVFGTNVLPQIQGVSIMQLMGASLQDKTLILLIIAAMVSLVVGLYEDMTSAEYDVFGNRIMGVKWVEGVAIILAVALVVVIGSVNDYQKEKQFRKLNAKKQDRQVNAIRFGHSCSISIYDIQVGDVLRLEPGDIVAADGVFIQGSNLKCDESATTGESEAVRKAGVEECVAMRWLTDNSTSSASTSLDMPTLACLSTQGNDMLFDDFAFSDNISDMQRQLPDPFLVSGSKVLEGVCTYIVTNVGVNSTYGKTMMALRTKDDNTPLQDKLDVLANNIAKYGVMAASFLFIVLLIRCVLGYSDVDGSKDAADVVYQIMRILITTVTVVVVAVPEGLPLAVTLALAYATQRMLKDNNLVRVLAACETMGNATTICTDKTGTITQNKMSVVAGTFGSSFRFLKDPPPTRADLVDLCNVRQQMPLPVRNFINQAIALNSTAFKSTSSTGETTLVGNKTEMAMLSFAQDYLASDPLELLRSRWHIEQIFPFNATQKAMGAVVRVPIIDKATHQERIVYRLHVKGASETLLKASSHIVSMHAESYKRFRGIQQGSCYDIETRPMTNENRERVSKVIKSYATRCMRTLAICYQDFEAWPSNQQLQDILASGRLTLLGVVGIEDPLRPGVKSAVAACQRAGVYVRMVTGDNMLTAKSIARQCGIYTKGGIAMEGPAFRHLSYSEQMQVLPRLCVLARSSPEDKRLLVDRLRELREIVAVTGDGTNDGPALKAADVGFSMGVTGTEVAKEASSIIIMDDNFSSIVQAISWGRCVNDSVKKFLQFQITVNITAVILTIVSAITSAQQRSVLTAVQLLWVNLIMDTFAALALATDPPTPNLLERLPEPRSAPLISISMWKMIIGQAVFQICIMLVLLYTDILDLEDDSATLQTFVFTTFVFCQIFNEVNCRQIDNQYNVIKGILDNKFFVIIFLLTVVVQVILVQYGGTAFQTTPLDFSYWFLSIAIGSMSIPIGALIRAIPNQVLTRKSTASISPRLKKVFMPDESRLVWNSVSLHDMQNIRDRHRKSLQSDRENVCTVEQPQLPPPQQQQQQQVQQHDKISLYTVV